jgi:hypothetical protein
MSKGFWAAHEVLPPPLVAKISLVLSVALLQVKEVRTVN